MANKPKKYRFYNYFEREWNYCEGEDKYSAILDYCRGSITATEFVIKHFRVERVY